MITKHFSPKTDKFLKCPCGKCTSKEIKLILYVVLEFVRSHFDKPVIIDSGYRCPKHNKKVGGVKNSQHKKANAVDFKIIGVKPIEIYVLLDTTFPNSFGIGLYNTFIHFDARLKKHRWNKQTKIKG